MTILRDLWVAITHNLCKDIYILHSVVVNIKIHSHVYMYVWCMVANLNRENCAKECVTPQEQKSSRIIIVSLGDCLTIM